MGSVEPFRALIVDDEQEMARTIKLLVDRRYSTTAVIAADCASAREELSTSSFDIIMLDYRLPDGDGLEFLQEINDKDSPPRVIMVTGQGDEQTAVDAFKHGASGYVVKDMRLSDLLVDAVEHALFEARLKQAEEALQKEKIFAETILDSLQDVSVVIGVEGGMIRWNRKLNEVTGYSDEEIASMKATDFFGQEDAWRLSEAIAEVVEGGQSSLDAPIKTSDGKEIPHYHVASLLKDAEGNPVGICSIARDITERKLAAEALKESEERYQLLVRNLTDVIWTTDMDLNLTYISPSVLNQTGYTANEVLSRSVMDFMTPASSEMAFARMKEELGRAGETDIDPPVIVELVLERHRKNGTTFWSEERVGFLRSEDGTPYGILGVSRDVTERKRVEEALRDSEEHYRSLFDDSPVSIWEEDLSAVKSRIDRLKESGVTDLDEFFEQNRDVLKEFAALVKVLDVNEVTMKMYGAKDRKEFLGGLGRVFSKETYEVIREGLVTLSKGGTSFQSESINLSLAGERIHVLTRWSIPAGHEDDWSKMMISLVDISKRKQAEEKLKRINVELEGYAQTVSHDLKGPLANIMLGAEMIVKLRHSTGSGDSGDIDEMADTIIRNARKANRRIEDVLVLAESGQEPRETSLVDVREVVEEVLEEMSNVIKEKGIEMDVSGDLGSVTANPTQIRQVFSNLVGNAIKYNDSENPIIRIAYLGDDGDSGQRYLVKDNGPGIPECIIDEVLLPFIKGKGGDTGVGLSIVENIVKAYGGQMRAYNEGGACFEFNLMGFQGK